MTAYEALVTALSAEREAMFGHDPSDNDLVPFERPGVFDEAEIVDAKLDELQSYVLEMKMDDAFEVLAMDNNDADPETDPADRIGRFNI